MCHVGGGGVSPPATKTVAGLAGLRRNRAQGVIWPGTWRVRTRRRSRAAWCGRLDAGVTGTASATSGGGGGVRGLVGIGVAVRVLANEGAGRGLRRSRSSSELLARAEELGGEPYDGNGGRRSSACGRAGYGERHGARRGKEEGRSSPGGTHDGPRRFSSSCAVDRRRRAPVIRSGRRGRGSVRGRPASCGSTGRRSRGRRSGWTR